MENKEEAKSLLTELIYLAKADKNLSKEEFQFLVNIAAQLDMQMTDLEDLIQTPADFVPPVNEFDRIVQFHRMVLLMNVDLSNSRKERTFLINSAMRLGLSPIVTNEILNKMDDYPNRIVPPDVLIAMFKTHYN